MRLKTALLALLYLMISETAVHAEETTTLTTGVRSRSLATNGEQFGTHPIVTNELMFSFSSGWYGVFLANTSLEHPGTKVSDGYENEVNLRAGYGHSGDKCQYLVEVAYLAEVDLDRTDDDSAQLRLRAYRPFDIASGHTVGPYAEAIGIYGLGENSGADGENYFVGILEHLQGGKFSIDNDLRVIYDTGTWSNVSGLLVRWNPKVTVQTSKHTSVILDGEFVVPLSGAENREKESCFGAAISFSF